jgi:hypothetical protein
MLAVMSAWQGRVSALSSTQKRGSPVSRAMILMIGGRSFA